MTRITMLHMSFFNHSYLDLNCLVFNFEIHLVSKTYAYSLGLRLCLDGFAVKDACIQVIVVLPYSIFILICGSFHLLFTCFPI